MTRLKYTPEQEQEMKAEYEAAEDDADRSTVVDELAEKYGKNRRQIIAKLVKMEVYKTVPRTSKVTGTRPETKEAMVRRLEVKKKWPSGDFNGLEKAPKIVLLKLLEEYQR